MVSICFPVLNLQKKNYCQTDYIIFLIMAIGAFIIIGFLTKTDDVNELKKRMLQAAMIICMTE